MFTEVKKITNLKKSTDIVLSDYKKRDKRLLLIAVLSGASANTLRQAGLTNVDLDKIEDLQNEFENLLFKAEKTCTGEVTIENHTFY